MKLFAITGIVLATGWYFYAEKQALIVQLGQEKAQITDLEAKVETAQKPPQYQLLNVEGLDKNEQGITYYRKYLCRLNTATGETWQLLKENYKDSNGAITPLYVWQEIRLFYDQTETDGLPDRIRKGELRPLN